MSFGKMIGIDERTNALLRMELLDLTKVLTRNDKTELDFQHHAGFRSDSNRMSISQFWEDLAEEDRLIGMKSDVVLHALGAYHHTNRESVRKFLDEVALAPFPQLYRQCFALIEEYRLESRCIDLRPGTRKWFRRRHSVKRAYMENRIRIHARHKERADARLLAFYCNIHTDDLPPYYVNELWDLLDESDRTAVQQAIDVFFFVGTIDSTEDASNVSMKISEHLSHEIKHDMKSRYFAIDAEWGMNPQSSPESRGSDLAEEDVQPAKNILPQDVKPDATDAEQIFETWNAETSDPKGADLLYETQSSSSLARVRPEMMDHITSGDDQMTSADEPYAMQGGRAGGEKSEESSSQMLQKRQSKIERSTMKEDRYGKRNRHAKKVVVAKRQPKDIEYAAYREISRAVSGDAKKLERTIRLTLERERTGDLHGLHIGRLGKKLTSILTEDEPRLFYKKKSPVQRLDTAFMLLIDCSASMYDKMDETKKGIALFHEALYRLQIAHEIVGFWEDAFPFGQKEYPNCFQTVIDFTSSLQPATGASIMQLEPQQDNRDGYAIRVVSERLQTRTEKQKVLLVFSDGEPAAADYYEEGVIDTYEAVLQARRQGIEVIGIFLADGEIKDSDREMMKTIYGSWNVIVPHASELTDHLTPLLRKLLIKGLY